VSYPYLFSESQNRAIKILTPSFTSYSGALGGRLCTDALNVRRLVGGNLALMVQCTASFLCGLVIAMIADWKLSLVILIVIPLMGVQGYAQVKFLEGFSQDAKVNHELALCYELLLFRLIHF
jgi:ATP-binding cassette subfamily B (MDR/TAP) protein 1